MGIGGARNVAGALSRKALSLSKVIVVNNVTLDGVMQAPGRPDEDTRGGFTHGGWALPYNDAVMGRAMGEGMAAGRDGSTAQPVRPVAITRRDRPEKRRIGVNR